jgi:prepilin-type N-terminal cleavage/methylation domain-containing protein
MLRARRAFTLIEVLIAFAILAIGMVGVMAAFASAIDLHKRGVDQTSAAMLADTILEYKQSEALEGVSADEMSTMSGGKYVFAPPTPDLPYQCKIICTELNDKEYKMIVEIRIRPTYTRRAGATDTEKETDTVRFETLLLRP